MSLRSWLIRGLILSGVAVIAALVWVANSWVSPERVRAQVIENLSDQFENVEVQVGSARMRILGGIAVSDLKLIHKGPNGNSQFLNVPSAVLYHDKEQLNRGRLVIKKIELESPELSLERSADGRWNIDDIFKKGEPADKPVPTFVIKDGKFRIIDRGPEPLPELTLEAVQLTLLNDPIPILAIKANATAKGFGPVSARAQLDRITRIFSMRLELSEVPFGEIVARHADRFAPGLSRHLSGLSATAGVIDKVTYDPNAARQWRHDVTVELKEARYTHPDLPWPVENIGAVFHILDGRLKDGEATAQVAGAKVKLAMEARQNEHEKIETVSSTSDNVLNCLEDHLAKLELSIDGLALDDVLFRVLPERARQFQREFKPSGQLDVSYKFNRKEKGWVRDLELRPKQIAMTYEKFPYPVTDVRGIVKRTMTNAGEPVTTIELRGIASKQTISIMGEIAGEGDDPRINLRVTGTNVTIDEKLFAAFPSKYADLVRRFRAAGRGDFVAEFIQAKGVNLCENEFTVDVRDATLCHQDYPYPVEKVKGRVVVRIAATDSTRPIHPGKEGETLPEKDEIVLTGFTAVHAGATITLSGSRSPIPGSRDKKLLLNVAGKQCPTDDHLKATCAALKVASIWNTFNPRGNLTFSAKVELLERAPPPNQPDLEVHFDPVSDLKLTLNFAEATATPSFFPYEMNDFSGLLEYKEGRVKLDHLSARHGESRAKLARGEVLFYPDGKVWANLGGLEVKPLIADEAFIKALPGKLGSGINELKLTGAAELLVRQLVVLTPPDAPSPQQMNPNVPLVRPVSNSLYERPQPPADGGSAGPTLPSLRGQLPGTPMPPPQPDPVVFWDLELKLLGSSLEIGVPWDQVNGKVDCQGLYESTHVGQIRGALLIDSTAIAGQPVTRILGRFGAAPQRPDPAKMGEFLPTELQFTDLTGLLFHGTLGGEARVSLASPVRFNLWLTASDVQLDEVAKHYKLGSNADLKGIAQAQLWLYNHPDPATGKLMIEGSGKIDVPTGRMYNLPILLDLVKLLKFEAPDKTAFEEAHAVFSIVGDRVKVEQIDLIGRAVCLGGSGEFDTSGNYVKFDFYTIISKVLALLINTPVGDLATYLSKELLVIRLTRENGELKYKSIPVPGVTEPVQVIADRLRFRVAKMFGGK
jgi:hypothetical protein